MCLANNLYMFACKPCMITKLCLYSPAACRCLHICFIRLDAPQVLSDPSRSVSVPVDMQFLAKCLGQR